MDLPSIIKALTGLLKLTKSEPTKNDNKNQISSGPIIGSVINQTNVLSPPKNSKLGLTFFILLAAIVVGGVYFGVLRIDTGKPLTKLPPNDNPAPAKEPPKEAPPSEPTPKGMSSYKPPADSESCSDPVHYKVIRQKMSEIGGIRYETMVMVTPRKYSDPASIDPVVIFRGNVPIIGGVGFAAFLQRTQVSSI